MYKNNRILLVDAFNALSHPLALWNEKLFSLNVHITYLILAPVKGFAKIIL